MTARKTDVVKLFLQAAMDRDWDRLGSYCHPSFRVTESDALPYAGVYRGVDGFRQLARIIFSDSFTDFTVTPEYYLEGDDQVLLMAAISGVGKPTGIAFASHVAEIYLFEDGLIREIRPFYWDPKLINRVLAKPGR